MNRWIWVWLSTIRTRRLVITLILSVLAGGTFNTSGQTLTTLWSFTGGSDGGFPYDGVVQGSDGCFYGTTERGGTNGNGTVFRISQSGTLTTLHSFTGGDGSAPQAMLVQDSDGAFYGTTSSGGSVSNGTVFRITIDGALTTLHNFTNGIDGTFPLGALVQGNDGNFYGTTDGGGSEFCECGTVFQISSAGTMTTLYQFNGSVGLPDGDQPTAGLVLGSDGHFYGTTFNGGTNAAGTVYKITSAGTFTLLHQFNPNIDGAYPDANLVRASDGMFYGTTVNGGLSGRGTVFKISPDGTTFVSLYQFTGTSDGASPKAALVQGSDGNLYGATTRFGTLGNGTIFQITTAGTLTTLSNFTGPPNGNAYINASIVQGSDGNFHGTTYYGGTNNNGTAFVFSYPLNPPANQISGIQFFSLFDSIGVGASIPSVAAETYQLQYTDSMSPTNWINTGGSITSIGGPMTLFDFGGVLPQQRFYRAVITP